MKLKSITKKFAKKQIIVIGDLMIDKYIWGGVSRISPEAPVQVVEVNEETYAPGGAANVASNISSLSGNVTIVGVAGEGPSSSILLSELKKRNIDTQGLIFDASRPTTMKMRIMGRSQQLLRVDYEKKSEIAQETKDKFEEVLAELIPQADAVVISDYAKGVVCKELMKSVLKKANAHAIPVIVDPKPEHKNLYKGVTVITPNNKEACELSGNEVVNNDQITAIGKQLQKELNTSILLTRGEKGMTVFERGADPFSIDTRAKEVFDVTGAGDTVVATVALSLAAGASLPEAAVLANHVAGIKVGKVGTSTVSLEELEKNLDHEGEN